LCAQATRGPAVAKSDGEENQLGSGKIMMKHRWYYGVRRTESSCIWNEGKSHVDEHMGGSPSSYIVLFEWGTMRRGAKTDAKIVWSTALPVD
jgi:hypothetical protein